MACPPARRTTCTTPAGTRCRPPWPARAPAASAACRPLLGRGGRGASGASSVRRAGREWATRGLPPPAPPAAPSAACRRRLPAAGRARFTASTAAPPAAPVPARTWADAKPLERGVGLGYKRGAAEGEPGVAGRGWAGRGAGDAEGWAGQGVQERQRAGRQAGRQGGARARQAARRGAVLARAGRSRRLTAAAAPPSSAAASGRWWHPRLQSGGRQEGGGWAGGNPGDRSRLRCSGRAAASARRLRSRSRPAAAAQPAGSPPARAAQVGTLAAQCAAHLPRSPQARPPCRKA